jgi:hypothetical protein
MSAKPKRRRSSSRSPSQRSSNPAQREAPAQAKLFWTGRSQAVRLPKEFRFEGDSVLIRREGNKVILEPDLGWPPGYLEWLFSGPGVYIEPPSRKGPARTRDVFQVPLDDGSGRTMNVFDLLELRARNRERAARKQKRRTR